MKYQDSTAFRQALEQRLKDRAAGDGAASRRRPFESFLLDVGFRPDGGLETETLRAS